MGAQSGSGEGVDGPGAATIRKELWVLDLIGGKMGRNGTDSQCRRNPLEVPGETPRSITPGQSPTGHLVLPPLWHMFTEHLLCIRLCTGPR